jgi:ketosteroid isomerase-like protein
MRHFQILIYAALLSLISGCSKEQTTPESRAEDERVIFGLEAEASKAIELKDLNHLISLYADDGALYYEDHPMVGGKDAVRQTWKAIFARPGFSMSARPREVEREISGDLGFAHGSYTMKMNDAAGRVIMDRGEYGVVYKRQPDGKWKIIADNGNSELGAHAFPKPPDRRIKPASPIAPLVGLASILAAIWFIFGMPILFATFAWKYFRSRKLSTGFVVSAVMLIAFFAAALLLWSQFAGHYWNLSFGTALRAGFDSERFGHPVEHTAEVLVVNLLIFSTVCSSAAGAVIGIFRHFRKKVSV